MDNTDWGWWESIIINVNVGRFSASNESCYHVGYMITRGPREPGSGKFQFQVGIQGSHRGRQHGAKGESDDDGG